MTSVSARFLRRYAAVVGVALAAVVIIGAIGYLPTFRLSGREGVAALAAGCGLSWLASCAGAVPLAMATARSTAQQANAVLVSTGVRFITVLALVAPAVFSGWFDRTVLVVWVVISYLLLLVVDTTLAIRLTKRTGEEAA